MTDLIIGNENVPFNLVIITMQSSSVFETCNDKWRDLAIKLDTSPGTKIQIEKNIMREKSYGVSDIILDLLHELRARLHENAKLEILTEALEDVGLLDISNILTKKFSTPANNETIDTASAKEEDDMPVTEEGKKLKEYLQYYIIDLIEITDLSDDLIQAMREKGVLESKDIHNTKRSRFLGDRVKRFYQIILGKVSKEPETYENMLAVFMADEQNRERGVADILNRYFD